MIGIVMSVRNTFSCIFATVIVIAAASVPSMASTNFVVNGSFEMNPFNGPRFADSLAGQNSGSFPEIEGFSGAFGSRNFEVQREGAAGDITTPFGEYYVELDTFSSGRGTVVGDLFAGLGIDPPSNGFLGQVLSLTPGNYVLEFYYRARSRRENDNGVLAGIASFDNPTLAQLAGDFQGFDQSVEVSLTRDDQLGFELQTLDFSVAEAGDFLLGFQGTGTPNGVGALIDNVGVFAAPDPVLSTTSFLSASVSAVPEPSTWILMLAGFACAGFTLRRRISDKALA